MKIDALDSLKYLLVLYCSLKGIQFQVNKRTYCWTYRSICSTKYLGGVHYLLYMRIRDE